MAARLQAPLRQGASSGQKLGLVALGLGGGLAIAWALRPKFRMPPTEPGPPGVDIDDLLRTIEELKALLDQAERQLEELRQRLQDAIGALDRLNEDVRRLEDLVSQLQNEKDELLRQIGEAERIAADLESTINGLDQELTRIASETGMTDEQIRAVRGYIDQLRALVDQLEAKLQEMRATLEQMQKTIDDLRATIDQLKADIAALKAALDAANALIAELQKTIDDLKATVAKLESQVKKLKVVVEWINYELQVKDQDVPAISARFQSAYSPGVYYMPPRQPSWEGVQQKKEGGWVDVAIELARGLRANRPYTYTHRLSYGSGTLLCTEKYLCCDGPSVCIPFVGCIRACPDCHTDKVTMKAWLEVLDASGNVLRTSSAVSGSGSGVHPGGLTQNSEVAYTPRDATLSVEIPAGTNLVLRLRVKLEGWAYRLGNTQFSVGESNAASPLYYGSELSFRGSSLSALEEQAAAVAGRLLHVEDAPADPELSVRERVARVVAVNGIQVGALILPFSQDVRLAWSGQGESTPNAWPYAGWFLFGTDGQRALVYAHAEKDLPAGSSTFSGETTVKLPSGAYILVAFAGSCPAGLQCQGVGSSLEISASYRFYSGLAQE